MITYNDFERYLTKIQKIHELEDKILNLGDEYSELVLEYVSPFAYHGVTMEDELIDCLEKGLNLRPDEYGDTWVSYWVWETDCGQRNTIVDPDNKEAPPAEIANLWKVIEWEKSGELNE